MRKTIQVNPNRRRNLRYRPKRLTLTEAVVVLAVGMVLTAILVPTLRSQAQANDILQARDDVQRIGEAIRRYFQDTNHLPGALDFTGDPTGRDGRKIQVLVTGGNTPRIAPRLGAEAWGEVPSGKLETFLQQPPLDFVATSPSRSRWRGPYMDAIPDADPWGNRYMVNVGLQDPIVSTTTHHQTQKAAIMVLSAGPDGIVDTPYHQYAGEATVRGDDITYRLQ